MDFAGSDASVLVVKFHFSLLRLRPGFTIYKHSLSPYPISVGEHCYLLPMNIFVIQNVGEYIPADLALCSVTGTCTGNCFMLSFSTMQLYIQQVGVACSAVRQIETYLNIFITSTS